MNQVVKIQSVYRGRYTRKLLVENTDGMTPDMLLRCIESYRQTIQNEKEMNAKLTNKKIRYSNFPSHISENIAKFAFGKKYGIMPTWDTKVGDLVVSKMSSPIRLEVKGSLNLANGPPTFGPTEVWDRILFVDAVDMYNDNYLVYEIQLSNQSQEWKQLKVSETQTYYDQCQQGRRPRLAFEKIQNQVGNKCNLIFDGHIKSLFQ